MSYRGDLVVESLGRPELLPALDVRSIRRVEALQGPVLPRLVAWNILAVEVPDQQASHDLAVAFTHAADAGHLGWYFDLLGVHEHLFSFLGRMIIVHAENAEQGYAEVEDFCGRRGIQADQLDFPRLGPAGQL